MLLAMAIIFGIYGIITSENLWKKIIYSIFIIPSVFAEDVPFPLGVNLM